MPFRAPIVTNPAPRGGSPRQRGFSWSFSRESNSRFDSSLEVLQVPRSPSPGPESLGTRPSPSWTRCGSDWKVRASLERLRWFGQTDQGSRLDGCVCAWPW